MVEIILVYRTATCVAMEDDGATEMRTQGTYPCAQLHLFTAVWVLRPPRGASVGGQYLGITCSTCPLSHLGAGLGRLDDPVMTSVPSSSAPLSHTEQAAPVFHAEV